MLSPKTVTSIDLLFKVEERAEAAHLLDAECGNNLPFLEKLNYSQLERYQFAALKISGGHLLGLREAIKVAQFDWRDLLMAAGFGHDVHAHEKWVPRPESPP